jgi:regulator of sirC expression with transglutaminase-like and TPR domain
MKPAPAARAALDRLLRLPEPEIPLAEAALLIAQEEYPELDVREYLARLTALGHQLARAIATYSQTEGSGPGGTWTRSERLRALRNFLYGELGFHGPRDEEFFDPRNSFLNDVLDRHTGPADHAGARLHRGRTRDRARARRRELPGHFLVKTVDEGPELLLDPFNRGREVTWVEAIERIEKVNGKKEPPEDYTEAVTPRRFLFRLLSNLKAAYLRDEKFEEAIATIDRLLMVHPSAHWERRDRALLLLKTGAYHRAAAELEAYLVAVPGADDRESVERRIEQARQLAAQLN